MGTQELTDRVPLDDEPIAGDDAAAAEAAANAAGSANDAGGDGEAAGTGAEASAASVDAGADELDREALEAAAGEERRGIPPERFNEVNERAKRAEAEAAELRQALLNVTGRQTQTDDAATTAATTTAAAPRDFEAEYKDLDDKYESGELDDAAYRRESRKLMREEATFHAEEKVKPLVTQLESDREQQALARIQVELNAEAAKAFEKYPFLDAKAANHNAEAIAAVLKERDELIGTGVAPGKALRLAVAAIAPDYVGQAPSTAGKTADEIAAARRRKAQETAAAADEGQPPALVGVGNGARETGKQRLSASVKDHDKWERTPAGERDKAFTA